MLRTIVIAGFLAVVLTATTATAQEPPLPDFFSLTYVEGESFVSPVKLQQGGTCWTHGTMASIESALMMNGNWAAAGDTGVPNLAEYHLDWWNGYNDHYNQDSDPPDSTFGVELHFGGDYRMATAYLSRGDGAVRDIDGQSYWTQPPRFDSSFHRYYVRDVEWYTVGDSLENIDVIKRRLMTDGAVATCIDADYAFMDQENWIHYQPPTAAPLPTHAVTIVGWNDYKETAAPLPGAWYVKNSWGGGWALTGYFWISYYDRWAGRHPYMGAVSFRNPELMSYDHVYYHDYHGWRKVKENVAEAVNAFRSEGGDRLDAVSFYTMSDSVAYTVRIYDRFENGQLSDELASQTGVIPYMGFHTIDLDTPVMLPGIDDLFYIYVAVSDSQQAYDCTAAVELLLGARGLPTVFSRSNPGESYYFEDGEWRDLYEWNNSANFCIKGLSRNVISFEATPRIGLVALDVQLTASSPLEVESWTWSFTDGGTCEGQQADHTFTCRGSYDVTVSAVSGGESYEVTAKEHVIALCDSLSVAPTSGSPGESIAVTVSGCTMIPLHQITVPIEVTGDVALAFDSASVAGCRTADFESVDMIHSDPANHRFTIRLLRSTVASDQCLEPGRGPLVNVYFRIVGRYTVGDSAMIAVDGYDTHVPTFSGPLLSYPATGGTGALTVASCCQQKGNIDGLPGSEGVVNVSDLTYLVSYLFLGGPPPPCMLEADLNGQTGEITVTDLTMLTAYLFQGAALPFGCP